jgi:hypothetical protein
MNAAMMKPVGADLLGTASIYRPGERADQSAVDSINRVPTGVVSVLFRQWAYIG